MDEEPAGIQSDSSGSATFQCPRCHALLTSSARLKKHLSEQPACCRKEQEKLQRSHNTRKDATPAIAPIAPEELHIHLAKLRRGVYLPDHVPKSVRPVVANALVDRLSRISAENTAESWIDFFVFAYVVLGQPRCEATKRSKETLPDIIRRNIRENRIPQVSSFVKDAARPPGDNGDIAKKVAKKLQEGNVSGAVKVLIRDEEIKGVTGEVLEELRKKHPENLPLTVEPPTERDPTPEEITVGETVAALRLFPRGSAGGCDGMRPNYLLELLNVSGELSKKLAGAICEVLNIMLLGDVPALILPVLYGANLVALEKPDGGIRPIAVGLALRRLIARIIVKRNAVVSSELRPVQLGFAVRAGAEGAVHATRCFLEQHKNDLQPSVLLKFDIRNAFNSLDRNVILTTVKEKIPLYYRFLWQCYGGETYLLCESEVIQSQRGVQQGDPLGPLLYSLSTYESHKYLQSELTASFADDDVLGGTAESVLANFEKLQEASEKQGLEFNIEKCELMISGGTSEKQAATVGLFTAKYPGLVCPAEDDQFYLGSPLNDRTTKIALDKLLLTTIKMSERLECLPTHQAFYLLKNCLGPVKMTYLLRTSRAYRAHAELRRFDDAMRKVVASICNIALTEAAWLQTSSPLYAGGLGIRRTEKLALPAFLASAHLVRELTTEILPSMDVGLYTSEALDAWRQCVLEPPPVDDLNATQKAWDKPVVDVTKRKVAELLKEDPTSKARLAAVDTKESGAWLEALPVACLGNLLDDRTFRISTALRVGANVTVPHRCKCGQQEDARGYHALSCQKSSGRRQRHAGLNNIIKRAFASAGVESTLEPTGLLNSDGKRPDGLTLAPWERGKCLTWDATCICTLAISHLAESSSTVAAAASTAERKKAEKYRLITADYIFVPLAFETFGPWGPEASRLLTDLGRKIKVVSGENRSLEYLRQRISIELQRGNAASILGTVTSSSDLSEMFLVNRQRNLL